MASKPETKNAAAVALGRRGGQANTSAQRTARQQNGALGGRPRRVCVECGEPVLGGHKDSALDDSCGAHGWRWQKPGEDAAPGTRQTRRAAADARLLVDVLRAFEGEEDSVRAEHARLIKRLRAAVA